MLGVALSKFSLHAVYASIAIFLTAGNALRLVATISPPIVAAPAEKTAAAKAELIGGFIVALTVLDPGLGYSEAPAILITGGGGIGASAVAHVSNGVVIGFTVTRAGFGYTSAPEIRIAPPGGFPLRLRLEPTHVRLRLHVVLGRSYQIETSNDKIVWSPLEEPLIADDEEMFVDVPMDRLGRFCRIYQIP